LNSTRIRTSVKSKDHDAAIPLYTTGLAQPEKHQFKPDREEGNTLKTISEARNLVAQVEVEEVFPQSFGIYDLGEFLSAIDLATTPELTFKDQYVVITDGSGRINIKYFFSNPQHLKGAAMDKVPHLPATNVEFTLDHNTAQGLKRAGSALGHEEIVITGNGKVITLSVMDKENSTSNSYSVDVPGSSDTTDFSFVLNMGNLRMLPADYKVCISSRLISSFESINLERPITYWIALEKSSRYN
jgi:hypothetical protein